MRTHLVALTIAGIYLLVMTLLGGSVAYLASAEQPQPPVVNNPATISASSPVVSIGGFATFPTVVFANLGTPGNGAMVYCSDCTVTTAATCPGTQASCVCAGSGTGEFARRVAATWLCTP